MLGRFRPRRGLDRRGTVVTGVGRDHVVDGGRAAMEHGAAVRRSRSQLGQAATDPGETGGGCVGSAW